MGFQQKKTTADKKTTLERQKKLMGGSGTFKAEPTPELKEKQALAAQDPDDARYTLKIHH